MLAVTIRQFYVLRHATCLNFMTFLTSGPCSAVWCSAADTHLKLLDRVVSGARFITGGVFECDITHRKICGSTLYVV